MSVRRPVHSAISAHGGVYLACNNRKAQFGDTISTGGPVNCDDCLVWLELNQRGPTGPSGVGGDRSDE